MGGFNSIIFLLILFGLMMEYSSSSVSGCFTTPKTHVRVKNKLGAGKKLHLECESKEDDLGEKALNYNQVFSWTFCGSVWTSTLFFCDFWYERNGTYVATHADVYFQQRDNCLDCSVLVGVKGVYVVDIKNPSDWKMVATWP
ncbi:S-protein homolog 29-like [Telopea speciosissima]|uniref:S-protein homolog 29-like n=1 Tax=Telopea speciosissima TaxID=54955 RepID=UPI001CC6B563|nr:S-protein homolog 29-like [Telopea speciosissima]